MKGANKSITDLLGIEVVELEKGHCVATMPVDERTHQPFGYLHGGASVVLAETIASLGTAFLIDLEKQSCFGLEINANHIRSKKDGIVTGIGKAVHIGRTTCVWEMHLQDEEGKLICTSRCTVAIVDKK